MPCNSGNEDIYLADLEAATRAACDLAMVLRSSRPNINDVTAETRKWIERHDAADQRRLKREAKIDRLEQTKKNALSKLTRAERKMLGL